MQSVGSSCCPPGTPNCRYNVSIDEEEVAVAAVVKSCHSEVLALKKLFPSRGPPFEICTNAETRVGERTFTQADAR
jgi:hypothetical protein